MSQRNLAILIFEDVEVLDFCGPFEVFAVCGQRGGAAGHFNVYTVAENNGPVSARNGLSVNPHYTIANCPQPDILLVPGGRGTRTLMHNPVITNWVKDQYTKVELLLSVCTGALVLAKAGLLEGLAATTHHSALDELRAIAPNTTICPTERYVDNGKIVLSAGVAAGIDMSFYVVGRLLGIETAAETASYIEYPWEPDKYAH